MLPCRKSEKSLILKDLLETNIRQRGDVGGSAKKVGLRIKELERLYGIHQGNNQYSLPNNSVSTQSDIATKFGMSVDTLQNYKLLAEMIPETEDEIAVLLWIAKHHLSSKNLEDGEKLAMTEEFKKEVVLENEKKKQKEDLQKTTLQLECRIIKSIQKQEFIVKHGQIRKLLKRQV